MHRHDCQSKTGKTTIQEIAEPALGRNKKLQQKSDQENKKQRITINEQHNSTITQSWRATDSVWTKHRCPTAILRRSTTEAPLLPPRRWRTPELRHQRRRNPWGRRCYPRGSLMWKLRIPQGPKIRKYRMLVVVHQPIWKICLSKWVHLPQVVVKIKKHQKHHADTVDRRNPAAVDMYSLSHLSPWFVFLYLPGGAGFLPSAVQPKKELVNNIWLTNGLGCFHQFRRCFLFNDSYIASVWVHGYVIVISRMQIQHMKRLKPSNTKEVVNKKHIVYQTIKKTNGISGFHHHVFWDWDSGCCCCGNVIFSRWIWFLKIRFSHSPKYPHRLNNSTNASNEGIGVSFHT